MFLLMVEMESGSTICFDSWATIRATRGAVRRWEAWKVLGDSTVGLRRPSPPSLTGRESRSLSSDEQGGCPVRAGMKWWWMAFSRGRSRSWMSGIVRSRYDHRLDNPCVKAACAAWGWDTAALANCWISLTQSWTLALTYSSVKVLEPRAAPRCCLPFVVTCTSVSANSRVAHFSWSSFTTR